MSKKKKTLDELLEEALVPEEEKPYEIPDNWCWVKLGQYFINCNGARIPISSKMRESMQGAIPYYGATGIVDYVNDFTHEGKYILVGEDGANLLSKSKPISFIVEGKSWVNNHAHVLKTPIGENEEYFNFYINSISLNKYVSGSAQPKLNQKNLNSIPIPLAPVEEQKRITNVVETLISKIDEAKQLIEEAKETFELRRAAILDKTFRGDLTAKWRKNNGYSDTENKNDNGPYKIPAEWKWTNIGEVTTFVGSGSTPKGGSAIYKSEGIPFIRSQNVLRNTMSVEDIVFITEEIHMGMKRTHMQGNETLLNITGASIGRASKILRELVPCNINQHVCALRFTDNILEELPQYWLNSPFIQKEINKMQIGATRQALNFPQVKSLPMPIIPLEEQEEIINIIKKFERKERNIEFIDNITMELERLKHSILSKAFKGELGTNDSTDEPAIELLKSILQEKL